MRKAPVGSGEGEREDPSRFGRRRRAAAMFFALADCDLNEGSIGRRRFVPIEPDIVFEPGAAVAVRL